MRKFLSALLAIILLLSSMSMLVFAEGEQGDGSGENELENIAPKGLGYCTSMKNSNWTPPNSINDGVYDWHGWEPKYPSIFPGQDTSAGFSGEYCGIKFINREYYEIHSMNITLGLHAQYRQNVIYTIQALVEGEWKDVVTLKDEQFKPTNYESYEDAMTNDTSNYHIEAKLSYTLPTPITTNNLRITVSEFGKGFPGGDVLIFPYIYEVELIGKRGVTPDIDLPEGAEFSQNASYNSLPYASSSTRLYYPFQAIDGKGTTGWRPSSLEAGQYLALEFAKEYTIDKLAINFGVLPAGKTSVDYAFKLQALVNGQWIDVSDSTKAVPHTEAETSFYIPEYTLDTAVKTTQVRILFEGALTSAPTIYELESNIVGDRSYYLATRFSSLEKLSSALGNLAILGEAYASQNIAPYSDPSFINDGLKFANSDVWFSGLIDIPVSCGVKLDKTYTVNKIVVYCEEPALIGDDVTRFNILAKINGEYQIVGTGRSYDPTKIVEDSETRYTTIYEFPEGIVTDDIKIEFTRGDSTIPNIKELEIYSNSAIASAFDGYPISSNSKVPVYTDVPPVSDDAPEGNTGDGDTTTDNGDESKGALVAGVVVCFVAVAITVFSLVTLNIKKNNAPKVSIEELEAEANADAEAEADVAEEASEEQAVSEDENPDQE